MKPQDIVFILILAGLLLFLRKPKVFVSVGLICLALSIPLFAKWIFFTAQRLTMYGAAFIFIGVILELIHFKPKK